MYSKIYGATTQGIEGKLVEVETYITAGLPSMKIIGMTDKAIQEASERVQSAIRNSGLDFPNRKIRVNLAPADEFKKGTGLDLAIAIGIFIASQKVNLDKDIYAFGELGLDGKIKNTAGLFQFLEASPTSGESYVLMPEIDSPVFRYFPGKKVAMFQSLKEVIQAFSKRKITLKTLSEKHGQVVTRDKKLVIHEIFGQERAKRAVLISAAGKHHILLAGSIGIGKTLLARSLAELISLPSEQESYEIYKIQSLFNEHNTLKFPFREIDPYISVASLIGGGNPPSPGEITKAHNGILFIDELAEYKSRVINSLRTPLENGYITITRHGHTYTFPSKFLLVAASNLCPCGKLGTSDQNCTCTPKEKEGYLKRIPQPIMNRIDIVVKLNNEAIQQRGLEKEQKVDYQSIIQKVKEVQAMRFKDEAFKWNSEIPHSAIKKHAPLSPEAESTLTTAIRKFSLNTRDYMKIIRLSRTIADIGSSKEIKAAHLLEALSYRT